jgi:hypothetical protein
MRTLMLLLCLLLSTTVSADVAGVYQWQPAGAVFPTHYVGVHQSGDRLLLVVHRADLTDWEVYDATVVSDEWAEVRLLHSNSTASATGWLQLLTFSGELVLYLEHCAGRLAVETNYFPDGFDDSGERLYRQESDLVERGCFVSGDGFARLVRLF